MAQSNAMQNANPQESIIDKTLPTFHNDDFPFDFKIIAFLAVIILASAIGKGQFIQIIALILAFINLQNPEGRVTVLLFATLLPGLGEYGYSLSEVAFPIIFVLLLLNVSQKKDRVVHAQFKKLSKYWRVLFLYVSLFSILLAVSNGVSFSKAFSDGLCYLVPFVSFAVAAIEVPKTSRKFQVWIAITYFVVATYFFTTSWAARRGYITSIQADAKQGIIPPFLFVIALTYPFRRRIIQLLTIVYATVMLALSGARSSWIAAVLAVAVAYVVPSKVRRNRSIGVAITATIALTLLVSLGIIPSSIVTSISSRFSKLGTVVNYGSSADASGFQRSIATENVLHDWSLSPIFGYGPGHSYSWQIIDRFLGQTVTNSASVDSPFAALAELGIIGYLILSVALIATCIALLSVGRSFPSFGIAVGVSVTFVVGALVFSNPVGSTSFAGTTICAMLLIGSYRYSQTVGKNVQEFFPEEIRAWRNKSV